MSGRRSSGNGFAGRQGGARGTAISGGTGSASEWQVGGGANLRNVWNIGSEPSAYDYCGPCDLFLIGPERKRAEVSVAVTTNGRQRWKPIGRVCPSCGGFMDNWVRHFASFPTEIPRRCIQASTSERGACVDCGAPWRRMTDARFRGDRDSSPLARRQVAATGGVLTGGTDHSSLGVPAVATVTLGWEPSCRCQQPRTVPCVVLDVFLGSGTTSVAAKQLGRRSIGIELNPRYAALAGHRTERDIPRWARPATAPRRPRVRRLAPLPAQMTLLEVVG